MSQLAARSMFAAIVLVPFAIAACDQMKKDSADAAIPVAVPTVATATAPVTATATDTATAAPTATPLTPTTATVAPTTTTVPTAKPDGGVVPPKPDGGTAPTAAPTSTFTVPTIPGFDAGAWKPPAGFPTAIPTFPPPQK